MLLAGHFKLALLNQQFASNKVCQQMKGKYPALMIKRKKMQQGVELVEHAITLFFFLILFFVILEGVRMIYSFTLVTQLASDAVRYSIVLILTHT